MTPHAVEIVGQAPIPPSGRVARIEERRVVIDAVEIGGLIGLEEVGPNNHGIVSRPVAYIAALTDHPTAPYLWVVDGFVRDPQGNVVGAERLIQVRANW